MLDIHLVQQADCCSRFADQVRRSARIRRRLATLKAEIATAYRRFDFTARCWVISADAYTCLAHYLGLMEARFCASILIRDETV